MKRHLFGSARPRCGSLTAFDTAACLTEPGAGHEEFACCSRRNACVVTSTAIHIGANHVLDFVRRHGLILVRGLVIQPADTFNI